MGKRTVRGLNPLNLSIDFHVLRAVSQVSVCFMIDEVVCQRVYGALPLSYGAMFENKVAPVGLEPTTSGLECCTPTRQSINVARPGIEPGSSV